MARRGVFTAVSVPVVALGLVGIALAQGSSYQTVNFVLEQPEPGRAAPVRIDIDYANPADPAGKPLAVAQVVETLPPGAKIDTSAAEHCTASDAAMATMGQAACPAGSKVGGGEVDLDTGVAVLNFNVTQFNNKDELILLFEQKGGGITTASRAKVEGDRAEGPRITVSVPPIPGGPPDGFTALKRVRLKLDAVTTGQGASAKNYVTTPPSCPTGSWSTVVDFTYRDGYKASVRSSSPCNKGAGNPVDRSPARIAIRGLPRDCASRSFRMRIRIRESLPLERAQVRLDGRVVKTTTRKRFKLRVPAGTLDEGRHRVAVSVRDQAGNRAKKSVRFRICG